MGGRDERGKALQEQDKKEGGEGEEGGAWAQERVRDAISQIYMFGLWRRDLSFSNLAIILEYPTGNFHRPRPPQALEEKGGSKKYPRSQVRITRTSAFGGADYTQTNSRVVGCFPVLRPVASRRGPLWSLCCDGRGHSRSNSRSSWAFSMRLSEFCARGPS